MSHQLNIWKLEHRLGVKQLFRFPQYKRTMWHTAIHYLRKLQDGGINTKGWSSVLQSFSNSLECEVPRHWLWCAYRLDAIGVTPALAKAVPVFCCCCNCCGVCSDPSRIFLRPRKFFLSPGSRMPVCTTGGNSGLTSWEVEGLQLLVEILLQWQRRCSKTDIPQHPPGQYLGGVWYESFQSWTRDVSLQIGGEVKQGISPVLLLLWCPRGQS